MRDMRKKCERAYVYSAAMGDAFRVSWRGEGVCFGLIAGLSARGVYMQGMFV